MLRRRQKPFEPLSDAHGAYLRELVGKAGKADRNRKVFGSGSHNYGLNRPVALETVRQFERRYHMTFPQEYVFFLTKVGNGGAGPYYGLYSLEELEKHTEYLNQYTSGDGESLPAFIHRDLSDRDWAEAMEEAGEADDQGYDQAMRRVCSGVLVIGTQGCSYDNLLMWKGSEQGKIVYIDWNLEPEYGPFFTGMTFLQWYEQFFLEILAGHDVAAYGYRSLQSQRELREAYPGAATPQERRRILDGFYKFREAEPATIEFLAGLAESEYAGLGTEQLFRLDLPRGLQVFEQLLGGTNLQAAVSCARKMPKEYRENYYHGLLPLLYRPQIQDKTRLLYFLGDCTSRRAADLAPFAMDETNSEEDRKTAVYEMGTCIDKMDYRGMFAELMRGESYWMAHTALQAVAGTPDPELLGTYEWMWERYGTDSVMRANLVIAFKTNGIERG